MKAIFEYKCRRCGQLTDGAHTNEIQAYSIMVNEILGMGTEAMVSAVSTHTSKCPDGGTGITDLIGYRVVQN